MRGRRLIAASALVPVLVTLTPAEQPSRSSKTEQAEVHLVLIDTVVTGEGGRPVPGLTKDRFVLRIDGKNAAIAAFEDHCAAEAPSGESGSPSPETSAAAPPQGPPASPAESSRLTPVLNAFPDPRRVVLYFDLPHLSPPGAARSVRAARRYLEATGVESARYMVVAYGPDVRILSPFTGDRDRILAALDRVMEKGVTYDEGPMARSSKIQEVTQETCPGSTAIHTCENQIQMASELAREEEAIARKSLDALRATLVSLEGVPGRKALVFFTETLRDEPGVYYLEIAGTTPGGEQISIDTEFRAAVEEANAASVSFYPVFAAGLDDESETELGRTVTSLGTKGERNNSYSQRLAGAAGRTPPPQGGTPQRRADIGPIADAQKSADAAALGFNVSIAAETGGRHLGRTNDLSLIFPIVREEMSCYYVLSYTPPSQSDGRRHMIAVSVDRKGLDVRSRQFYVDYSPVERAERRMKTALAAPGAFQDLGVKLDAFALGRTKEGRQVLVEATIPASDLARSAAGLQPEDGAAGVKLQGHVTDARSELCSFKADFTMAEVAVAAARNASLHYEAACSLPPGPCEISAAVMEVKSGALGAARREIGVPSISGFHVSEPQLWASAAADLLFREQASAIFGPTNGITRGAAAPRAERRLMPGEKGSLLFLICPPDTRAESGPVVVTRVILSGENPVATFPPLKLTDKPDPGTGCWGVSSEISSKVFGEGVYTFTYEVTAPGMSEPISRSAAFAVGGEDQAAKPQP